jgi:hypothetical protein
MEMSAKVELFEQIRREYEFGVGTIRGVAHKLKVHRRMVRQALTSAEPPERKQAGVAAAALRKVTMRTRSKRLSGDLFVRKPPTSASRLFVA